MMAAGSTIVAFKQGLKAKLLVRPALAAVQISYAQPTVFTEDFTIWFGNAEANGSLVTMRGGGVLSIEEDYQVELHIQAITFDDDGQEVADIRALELLTEVQKELAETPQTIPEIMAAEFAGWAQSIDALAGDAAGYGSHFEVTIRVRARLP